MLVGCGVHNDFAGSEIPSGAEAIADAYEYDGGGQCVAVSFRSTDSMTQSIVAHECLHAAWRVFDMLGVKADKDNHEHLAYLMEWMIERVFEVKKGLK